MRDPRAGVSMIELLLGMGMAGLAVFLTNDLLDMNRRSQTALATRFDADRLLARMEQVLQEPGLCGCNLAGRDVPVLGKRERNEDEIPLPLNVWDPACKRSLQAVAEPGMRVGRWQKIRRAGLRRFERVTRSRYDAVYAVELEVADGAPAVGASRLTREVPVTLVVNPTLKSEGDSFTRIQSCWRKTEGERLAGVEWQLRQGGDPGGYLLEIGKHPEALYARVTVRGTRRPKKPPGEKEGFGSPPPGQGADLSAWELTLDLRTERIEGVHWFAGGPQGMRSYLGHVRVDLPEPPSRRARYPACCRPVELAPREGCVSESETPPAECRFEGVSRAERESPGATSPFLWFGWATYDNGKPWDLWVAKGEPGFDQLWTFEYYR